MLSCASCESALAILPIPSTLSNASMDKLCQAYRKQIVTRHSKECPFGMSDEQYESILEAADRQQQQKDDPLSSVVPSYMAAVLPGASVQILQHPTPSHLLRQRIQDMQSLLPKNNNNNNNNNKIWRFPKLQQHEIPSNLQQFLATDNAQSLLNNCHDESILALAVLGWTAIPRNLKQQQQQQPKAAEEIHLVSVGCPLCLARMELLLEEQSNDDNPNSPGRPTKRPRTSTVVPKHPVDAHRHYCPYRVGFPTKMTDTKEDAAVWQPLLHRLQQEAAAAAAPAATNQQHDDAAIVITTTTTLEDMDRSIDKVRRILRSGIVKKTIDLSSDVMAQQNLG
jgi:C3HC zinc finger-like/Rsm1-like